MRIVAALLAVAPLVCPAEADGLRGAPAPCFEACQMVLHPILFNDTAGLSPSPPTRQCQSHKGLASLYLCAQVFCSVDERTAGLNFLNSTCHKKVNDSIPSFDLIANYTDDIIARLPRFEKPDYIDGTTFQDVAVPSDGFFRLAYDTLASWSYAYGYHFRYGAAMLVFWGLVVTIGLLNRILLYLMHKTKSQTRISDSAHSGASEDGEALIPSRNPRLGRFGGWLNAHVFLPATFGYRKAQPFGWYTVPPRIQSLTILLFIIMNFVFTVHGYHVFPENLYYPRVISQTLRYVSDRTGIIAFANFPLIWLFGMRNNVMLWVTGWDFATYNNFHRWIARVSTAQAVIHSVGYTILVFYENGWGHFVAYWHVTWWFSKAAILMCALLPLSLYWLRRHMYEGFLIIHIALSILVLAAMWGHIYPFSRGVPWDSIVWVSCSIWAVDRIARMTRTLCFSRKIWNTQAQATYERDANIVRLSIPTSQSWYRPRPGTFYYLHFLNGGRFWESHPFTMSSIRHGKATGTGLLSRTSLDTAEGMGLLSADVEVESLKSETTHPDAPTMNFIIRPYDSSTRRLAVAVEKESPSSCMLKVLVEGPYGHTQPFHQYHSILFIVGGSGIVSALVYLRELCRDAAQIKNVHIVWAVREAAFASSVLRDDMADLHESGKLTLDIYLTAHEAHHTLESLPEGVSKHMGRPDIIAEVGSAIHRFGRTGSLAVVACAPARMADDARKAVVHTLATQASRQTSNISKYFGKDLVVVMTFLHEPPEYAVQ
ncbi:hypothetical protein PFICI_06730 [Pestalotiopsis fici W106-1]|uniref:FAD-binding FR-type domain-containing protein n=1 Tax=Pestalotiopsis fici (strain W106-1 / CGMCC3.15140) TaxID=1229662 RepID=W3X6K4_PESFW|nr:uncharacterized protein PFICI_06730 [Pestalotiopsis fici W106-1]ETS81728.1 hypothetical protein PFICI_06730 [Pestalotiopsis fici W106-1]